MTLIARDRGLATPELLRFREHEKIVERNLQGFIEAGIALTAIKADREYRLDGYKSFEDYCRERWDISRPRAYQLVVAASIAEELSTNVDTPVPVREAQVRPLTLLRSDDDKREAWAEAVEEAGGQPSAEQVTRAVARRQPPRPQTDEERATEDDHFRAEARRQFNSSMGNALFSLSVLADSPEKLSDFVEHYEAPATPLTLDEIKAVGRAIDQMTNEWRYP